jgi:hypothetical protein
VAPGQEWITTYECLCDLRSIKHGSCFSGIAGIYILHQQN